MAIQRYKQTARTFEFEGLTIGIRRPTTGEMIQISKKRESYMKTVKAQILEEKKNETGAPLEGDTSYLFELHKFVSGLLCCDPEDVSVPWFADNEAEGKRLGKDCVDDVPQALHAKAFEAFIAQDQQIVNAAKDGAPASEVSADTAPLPTTVTEPTTTSGSEETSLSSASGSADSIQTST